MGGSQGSRGCITCNSHRLMSQSQTDWRPEANVGGKCLAFNVLPLRHRPTMRKLPHFVETILPTETKFEIRNLLQWNVLKARSHIEVLAAFHFNLRNVLLVQLFFVGTGLDWYSCVAHNLVSFKHYIFYQIIDNPLRLTCHFKFGSKLIYWFQSWQVGVENNIDFV